MPAVLFDLACGLGHRPLTRTCRLQAKAEADANYPLFCPKPE